MKFFFEPSNVALIGATETHGKPGRNLHVNLSGGFGDNYYPVNPKGGELSGRKVYKSITEIPVDIDVAVIFIPAKFTLDAVKECVEKDVKGIIIQSAGYSEVGEEGKLLQEKIVQTANDAGIRVWGPNCMGVINGNKRYVISFMSPRPWDEKLIPGGLSMVVQSGMLSAGFLISAMGRANFGLSKVCSIGNKADVNELDVLEYLIKDDETKVVAMYLESITDGPRFMKAAKNAGKPIVVLKGGVSEGGARAAVSHTASIAGDRRIIDGALEQANVVRVEGFYELLDVARMLDRYGRRPKKNAKLAVLTFSGAAGIVTSDTIDSMGMELAEYSDDTKKKLEKIYPPWMPPENPADLYPAIEINGPIKTYAVALKASLEDDNVDAIMMHIFAMPIQLIGDKLDEWSDIIAKYNKPVVAWLMGDPESSIKMSWELEMRGLPVMPDIRRAASTLAAVFSGR